MREGVDDTEGAVHGLEMAVFSCHIAPQGTHGREGRERQHFLPFQLCSQGHGRVEAAGRAFHIALDAGHLAGEEALRP